VAKVPSIVATLGTFTVVRGVTEIVMGEEWITDLPQGLRDLGTGAPLGVPLCLWVAAVVVAVSVVIARRTRLGVRVYAVGGKQYVVIARVSPQHAKKGGRLFVEETVEGRRYPIPSTVVDMPFFDPPRKKEVLS